MIGIYKITNKINNKVYIGQSKQVEHRLREHQLRPFRGDEKTNKEYNKYLYKAIRKYGLENFSFDILEECLEEELADKESYYINLFHSNEEQFGYNNTDGYEYSSYGMKGSHHPNSKLTEKDVYYIRECYNLHKDKNEVYEEFKDRINKTGFHKIWNNATWKNIHQDVYTEENRQYYLYKRNSHPGSTNPKAILKEEDVYNIRLRKKNGEQRKDVYEDYKHTGMTFGSFTCVWNGSNWKHVIV